MNRSLLYRLYPSEIQSKRLDSLLDIARAFYNAGLQERRDAWQRHHISLNYYDQANQIKEIRGATPEYTLLNHSVTQNVLRRLDRAFQSFFRRVKNGEKAGYPRFKGRDRYNSVTFPTYIGNNRYAAKGYQVLADRQRRLATKQRGSNNRAKAKLLASKAHEKVRNQRKDFAHKLARSLVETYDFIALERLNIKGMVRNHHLARVISDVGWGQFIWVLRYKAEEAGVVCVLVNPHNTSQRCSSCGNIVPKALSERMHSCSCCGIVLHRDLNASLNILALGRSVWAKSQEAVCVN